MEKITMLSDENGEELEFYVLEQTKVNGVTYILVTDSEYGDAECTILKDTSDAEDKDCVFEFVEDDVEMNAVFKIFEELLEDVDIEGLKVTNQRLLVLEVLADHRDTHMTAEDIYDLVKEDYPEIGLATIYRTLQLLLNMQLVDRINLDVGCIRYEIGDQLNGEL